MNFFHLFRMNPSKKENLESYIQNIILKFNLKYLIPSDKNASSRNKHFTYKCQNNHINTISRGQVNKLIKKDIFFCSICVKENAKRLFFDKCLLKIKENGGTFIKINKQSGIIFTVTCQENHKFNIYSHDLKKNKWCHTCKVEQELYIKYNKILDKKGFSLYKKYRKGEGKIHIKCKECFSEFTKSAKSLKKIQECINCQNDIFWNNKTKDIKKYFKTVDINLINKKIKSSSDLINLNCTRCKNNWNCSYNSATTLIFNHGRGCPKCVQILNKKGNSIEKCRTYAKKQNGKCLSTKYISQNEQMDWKCQNNHLWKATFKNIKRGSWCTQCANIKKSKGEFLTRQILEYIFETNLPSTYPEWLINTKTGRKMEVDGWCPLQKIGFEYHGPQHYNYIEHFHRTKERFINQQKRDKLKKKIFKKNNYLLLEIKYISLNNTIEIITKNIITAIENSFKERKLKIPDKLYKIQVDMRNDSLFYLKKPIDEQTK